MVRVISPPNQGLRELTLCPVILLKYLNSNIETKGTSLETCALCTVTQETEFMLDM